MRINDVERITGLSQKAIRLYESKGLIVISRDDNGYRNYTDENINALKKIKLLRSAGVSIADIKLLLFGVMNIDEVMNKRKSEILKESGINSEKYRICEIISEKGDIDDLKTAEKFTENEEETENETYGELSVGIDIGTTTVSAIVYDIDKKEPIETYTVPHNSYICSDTRSEQSVFVITDKAEKLLYHILNSYKGIVSIGLTGQMHGIVYIDENGVPISNLINWQDKRSDIAFEDGTTACGKIKRITGEHIAAGFGIATHYYNMLRGEVPNGAVGFCSIMDLFGMKICGLKRTVTHSSVAASYGLFDVRDGKFMKDKLSLLGIGDNFLPRVTGESTVIGECRGIPVSVALGDNQASFLGSVGDNRDTLLVNIGTGSQVSAVCDNGGESLKSDGDAELRPFIDGKFLMCGSALCGGFAYSMVEKFFESYITSAGMQDISQYKTINKLAEEAYNKGETGLDVNVTFFGKRSNPDLRGSIKGIDRQNFTPSALVLGTLKGMCNELYELYETFDEKKTRIVASGGAVKRNDVLKKLIADRFGMAVLLNTTDEDAAMGAALFSAYAARKIGSDGGFSEYIKYKY